VRTKNVRCALTTAPATVSQNPRHDSAKTFAATIGRKEPGQFRGFTRALDAYLKLRDRFYPEQAHLAVDRRQCAAIYFSARDRHQRFKRAS
jgi:hypothetical protein